MVNAVTTNCKGCNNSISGNYCTNCGQPATLKRVDSHYIIHEIQHILHFEKGILYTVKELLTSPGQNIKEFIADNRSRLVKPIIFIIVTSLVYTTIVHFFHIEQGYVEHSAVKGSAVNSIFAWVEGHYGYGNLVMGVFIALWLKIFFRKYDYNFFEVLILLCFVMGMGMLFFAVFAIIQALTHINLMQVAGITGIAYCTWAIGQFFDKGKAINYVKAFTAYMLGMLTFMLMAVALGILIDLMIKH